MIAHFSDIWHHHGSYEWLIQMAIILTASILISWIAAGLMKQLRVRLQKTQHVWDDTLVASLKRPVLLLIGFFAVTWLWRIAVEAVSGGLLITVWPLIYQLAVVAMVFLFLMTYINKIQSSYANKQTKQRASKSQRTSLTAVCQLARITVICIMVIVAMQTLGIKMSALLALGGVGGLAIGFAAKDTIANFLGGLMIFVDRPFEVGDWIASPNEQLEGTVEHIGWRLTKIRAFDKRPLYVPNSLFSTIVINNPSRMSNRRIRTTIGVRYDDAKVVEPMLKKVESMLAQHPDIDQNQTTFVNLTEFGHSSLNFLVYTFTKTTDWVKFQQIQQDVFLKIIAIITDFGAECAFPTTTLEVPKGIVVTTQEEQEVGYDQK